MAVGGKRGWGKRGWGKGGGGAGKDLLDFRADSLEFFNTKQARIWKHTPILAFTVCTVCRPGAGERCEVETREATRQG
jgi:hypothetical protein